MVEDRGAVFHVVLPANLEWGASVPNPRGRPFAVTNAHGVTCWDPNSRTSEGCSGPTGNSGAAGPGFLVATEPPGALLAATHDGRTWFSINGRPGAFGNNEGFYEFDVAIK